MVAFTAFHRSTPFISMTILMLGVGLLNTLVPLTLNVEGYSEFVVGAVGSVYYLGMFAGSISVIKFLDKVGPSKVFILATLVLSFVTLVPGLKINLIIWCAARFIGGYSLAWLYILVESWLLNSSTKNNRGQYLAIYMIVLYVGQAAGQLFLQVTGISGLTPFVLASALTIAAGIPMILAKNPMPSIGIPQSMGFIKLYKISPTGIIGCVISGVLLASVYSLLPVYLKESNYNTSEIAATMAISITGGVVLQYPFGVISDKIDRRFVLILLSILGVFISFVMLGITYFDLKGDMLIASLMFVFGGITFSLYPISLNHTCDYVDNRYVVEVTQGMMLAYGAGSVIGPVTISIIMSKVGPSGIFYSFALAFCLVLIFMLTRIFLSRKTISTKGSSYIKHPRGIHKEPRSRS
jgi:MFS family permease